MVFSVEIREKKVFRLHMLNSQCHFDQPPLELMGPLLGPLKPTAFLKPMGPGVIVPPCPLLSARLGPCMVVNIVANYCCKRKMLKETETEKRIGFFVIDDISIGNACPLASLWGPGSVSYDKSSPGYCITFITR